MKHILVHDIFAPLEVQDNSLWIFILLVTVCMTAAVIGLIWLVKKYRYNKDKNFKKYLDILKKCDLTQARTSAYRISYYGMLLAQTNEEKDLLETLIAALEAYKYKKNPPEISSEVKEQFLMFIEILESKHV